MERKHPWIQLQIPVGPHQTYQHMHPASCKRGKNDKRNNWRMAKTSQIFVKALHLRNSAGSKKDTLKDHTQRLRQSPREESQQQRETHNWSHTTLLREKSWLPIRNLESGGSGIMFAKWPKQAVYPDSTPEKLVIKNEGRINVSQEKQTAFVPSRVCPTLTRHQIAIQILNF